MNNSWSQVSLGDLLNRVKDEVDILEDVTYKQVTIRLWNKGVILRSSLPGSEIKTKRQFKIRRGQLVLSRIDVRNGAIGLVPQDLDGAIVSNDFWTYNIDLNRLDSKFLAICVTTPSFLDKANRTSSGTTNRIRAEEEAFLRIEIPLPPLLEQQRIVAMIEQLAAKIREAQKWKQQSIDEADALLNAALARILSENSNNSDWEFGNLSLFAEINPSRQGKINLGSADLVSFVPMRAVDDVTGTIQQPESRQFIEVSKGYTWFVDGDVIFARITPCMENGKAALAQNLKNGAGFGSTEFHVIRPIAKVMAKWLHRIIRSESFRNDAATHFKGTAGQQRVPQSFLERKVIAVPPIDEQRRIVAYLDSLQAKVDRLKALQAQTAAELEALLPSVLDKAFKGEL